ncbi:MAG: Cof-type HAD-IIB family hydrolase [Phycisphaerae bacterium]|jgi:Cof subfamily protein (haloacid dehalogenase superfamily)
MSKIHMVAIDLDGTLLNSAKQVTVTTAAILRRARQEAGVHVVLASARPPRSVMPFYNLLDLDTPMICYNGALVLDPPSGTVILHLPIAIDIARDIVTLARKEYPQVLVSAEILDRWCTDRLDPAFLTETGKVFNPDVIAPVDDWLTVPVTKLLLLGQPEPLLKVGRAIVQAHPQQVNVMMTEDHLLQICHATVSKAKALRAVAGELGVASHEVMAIGDNDNDVDMLQWAGIAVAMGNATPGVLAVADYVTAHHDADGAANAILRLIIEGLPKKKGSKGKSGT